MSAVILITLVIGIFVGFILPENISVLLNEASSVMLLLLLFCVGIDMGRNKEAFFQIKRMGFRILLIPASVVVGSLLGGAVGALIMQTSLREGLAITAGLGWYSLSGLLLTEAGNPIAGTVSFLANIFREILTFVVVPVVAVRLNYASAIAPGGATSMDTTLGIISKHTDGQTAVLAFVNGVVCTLIVPLLIPLFL